MRCITGQLKVWLQLQITETTTYNQLRELVVAYERSTSRWTESMVLGADAVVDTSAPMEVDRIQQKGKGFKGKDGKGKGVKGKDGKGKDGFKSKGKTKGGKQFHPHQFQKSSGKSWSGHSKGKDQNRDKGKGFGGKTNSGGKGQTISCWTCGGNYKAENCWKNSHVRNVVDEQHASNDVQHGNEHSQSQSTNSQAASSYQPSSASNNVSSSASIRAVHDESFSCQVGVEHFFIGSDDDSCEHDLYSSLLHQDIYDTYERDWNPYGVLSCDLSIYDGVEVALQCLRDDRPWKSSDFECSRFHACQVDRPHFNMFVL